MADPRQITPQQVIARDVLTSGDPRGEIVADRILAALASAGFVVAPAEPVDPDALERGQDLALAGYRIATTGEERAAWHALLLASGCYLPKEAPDAE